MIVRTMLATVLASLTFTGTACASDGLTLHTTTRARPHTACVYEDSVWCVWDARHQGNGIGRSYWVGAHGRIHYVSHRTAHHMIYR